MRLSKKHTVNWSTRFNVATPDRAPMSQAEFQTLCLKLQINDGLTAAKAFGLSWRTCQRYWYGALSVPGPLARLLRLAAEYQVTAQQLTGSSRKNTRPKPKA
jgi:hypothetical protein